MQPSIHIQNSFQLTENLLYLLKDAEELNDLSLSEAEAQWVKKKLDQDQSLIALNRYNSWLFLLKVKEKEEEYRTLETFRKKAHELSSLLKKESVNQLQLAGKQIAAPYLLAVLEGLLLSSYRFEKYKSRKTEADKILQQIKLSHPKVTEEQANEVLQLAKATFAARDLVNEPVIYLSATQLGHELERLGQEAGFQVEVLEESRIQSLKMGGLLAVNAGSQQPPTFSILEYKPKNAVNTQPIVLVGKGVVYDTGGLSLKPTPGSMDMMKSDMGGAASVAGALYAVAANKLPVHVIGLIPATDNRPGEEAITPGDVITISNGKTVEVLNTDAEGRLILADALCYAQRYRPALVIDLATLTGAAARAIGPEGIVCMGTAEENQKQQLCEAGREVYERLVEFPLWEEYEKQLESSIADLSNLGGPNAGAITAGLFLKHFTDYPWMHLDIAGPAFLTKPDSYRGKGGSGVGVRLLYQFIKRFDKK
ncbi:leucyl aminopeptidase family protein [Nafulsella turpanensis]|uniref:leucyl aminopeptidase family protein n=1 Tax=Nafulsella turpanensis TaxID=1265690 RepID=UPI000349652D|nr:leucyl aminopeptidase family protein [Nafulsella turpanensis]